MSTQVPIAIRTLNTQFRSANINVPVNLASVDIVLTSDSWPSSPDGRTINFNLEQSKDGGTTWEDWSSDVFTVGFGTHRDGSPSTDMPRCHIECGHYARLGRLTITPSASVRIGAVVTIN
jgi:hypothetical protein